MGRCDICDQDNRVVLAGCFSGGLALDDWDICDGTWRKSFRMEESHEERNSEKRTAGDGVLCITLRRNEAG